MKRIAVFSVILLLGAVAAFAEPVQSHRFSNRLLNDVVEMTRAGLPDETIIAFVHARRTRLDVDVSAGDLIRLRQSGVSENVVRYIAGAVDIEGESGGPSREMTYDSSGEAAYPVEPSEAGDEAYPYSYAGGYPYWYGWLGDPYWYGYGPYFSTGIFVGGRSFHGRGFDHRGSGHRSGGHGGPGGHSRRGGGHSGSGGRGRR